MAKEPHPGEELSRLQRALEGALAPAYVVRGAERWYVQRALERVREAATKAGLELCAHDAADPAFEPAALLDDLCGTAMFAAARCVVLQGAEAALKKSGSVEAPATRAIRAFLEGRRGTVVIVSDGLRADHAVVKACAKAGGEAFSFRPLWDTPAPWNPDPSRTELVEWIGARARELGLRLSRDQGLLLSKAKGNDLFALDAELVRLREGGAQAARALESDAAGSPTRLADSLVAGDCPSALAELERLWSGGFTRGKGGGDRETGAAAILAVLFGSLRRGVRQGLVGSAALESGADPKRAADLAGVPAWPKARQAFQAGLAARAPDDWRRMHADLLALERRSRSRAVVDAADLAALALRWRRTARPAGRGR